MRTDSSPVPVKLTVKQFIGSDWMVACMVPKGNMMHCMLREVDGAIKQLKYSITGKEIPVEIMEIETIMSQFFEGEISDIKREGKVLDWSSSATDSVCRGETDPEGWRKRDGVHSGQRPEVTRDYFLYILLFL